jgi:hypothetical protein
VAKETRGEGCPSLSQKCSAQRETKTKGRGSKRKEREREERERRKKTKLDYWIDRIDRRN